MRDLGLAVIAAAFLLLLIPSILYLFNADKGKELFGLYGLFFGSIMRTRTKPGRHARQGEVVQHEHARQKERKSMLMTVTDFVRPASWRKP